MSASKYFELVKERLAIIESEELPKIEQLAATVTDRLMAGGALFSFGCTHASIITQEITYRAGGLMLANPLFAMETDVRVRPATRTSLMERVHEYGRIIVQESPAKAGDVLLVTSVSGRNAVPIDVARAGKEKGLYVVALTSLAASEPLSSRHKDGYKLYDVVDFVLDHHCIVGDALVEIPGVAQKVGPSSTIGAVLIVNALICEVVKLMAERGEEPPIFMSGNVDGGTEYNRRMLDKYADRIHYMD